MKLPGRVRRHKRIRKNLWGVSDKPRLCVFRSNQHIYAQIIDDSKGIVICGVSSVNTPGLKGKKKIDVAHEIGRAVAKLALEKGIKKVCFDRSGYKYHGRIKALADGARESGLKF